MATGWQTFPIELTGGLVTDLSRLQQGLKAPGSARMLTNFEASNKGGYRRINGYTKFSDSIVPAYGDPRVQGGSQTGTSLDIANIYVSPAVGDSFTISGVTGTYTITAVSFSSTGKSATLTLDTSLASSPADRAEITFSDTDNKMEGLYVFEGNVYAFRDGKMWYGTGTTWSKVGPPNYGTISVFGGGQTGTSLQVDGISADAYAPQIGDTFTIAGIALIYTVTGEGTPSGGTTTLTISPALDSSPADNAVLTFLNTELAEGNHVRFAPFNFDGNRKLAFVDGVDYPHVITESNILERVNGTTDVLGAQHVTEFQDHMFYAKDDLITFTEPFLENGFDTGLGAGSFRVPADVTGMIVFRDKMFIFTKRTIHELNGSSSANFALDDVSREIGCVRPDTVQEVGGDVLFMGPDGVRFLGATDRIGDFNFANASKPIQDKVDTFDNNYDDFCSVVVTEKSQYRVFGHKSTQAREASRGFIGVQKLSQEAYSFEWSETLGIKAYRAASGTLDNNESVIHCENGGYVYQQEVGSNFDGDDIKAYFYTPWYVMDDPNIRKTQYKLTTFIDPDGPITGEISPRFNFNQSNTIHPNVKPFDTGGALFSVYGIAVYGVSLYSGGDPPKSIITNYVEGSFFAVSYQYTFIGTDQPFTIDTITVDYLLNDKK